MPSEEIGPIPIPAYGAFLAVCPYDLLSRPSIAEAWIAYRWWEKGQLGLLYQGGLPSCVSRAVTALDQGVSYGERDRLEASEKRSKH